MIDDNASYVGAIIENQDAIDAYEMIRENLVRQRDPEDFIDIITTALIKIPELIELENILYIIDDRYSRHPNLRKVSGREILLTEIRLMREMHEYPEALIDFYMNKYKKGEESEEESEYDDDSSSYASNDSNDRYALLSKLWQINHAYHACYELRNYVSGLNKLKSNWGTACPPKPPP